ncbi:MAG TPA: hypothetical protein VGJ71_03650, partial [Candidatus Limnocylindrales bacterium]
MATIGGVSRPCALAAGAGSVWVTEYLPTAVVRIDPATNTVGDRFALEGEACGVAYAHDAVWVTELGVGAVVRLDPTTGRVTATIKTP